LRRCCSITEKIKVNKNTYEIDGKHYVRVTRVLDIVAKPEFYRWYAKHGYEWCINYRDDRASFGTRVHKEIQNRLEDKNVWLDNSEMSSVFEHFKKWEKSHELIPIFLEKRLVSDELMSAGTCDYVGMVDGRLMVLDWKTSKRVYDMYPVQVAIYLWMYEQMTGAVVDGGAGVVCFKRDGVVEKFFSRDECLELVDVFRHARALYKWKYNK